VERRAVVEAGAEHTVEDAGARLPSEADLGRRFGASRITVGRALRDLQTAGLVERRAGSGTFVRVPHAHARAQAFGVLILLSIALSGLGFIVAWQFDSIQGFHAIMNLGLVPLWILSGAAFPAVGAAPWVRVLMTANPLTYGVAALRHVLSPTPLAGEPPLGLCLLVVALFGIMTMCLSIVLVRRDAR